MDYDAKTDQRIPQEGSMGYYSFTHKRLEEKLDTVRWTVESLTKDVRRLEDKQKEAQEPKKEPEQYEESYCWEVIKYLSKRSDKDLTKTEIYLMQNYLEKAIIAIQAYSEAKDKFIELNQHRAEPAPSLY